MLSKEDLIKKGFSLIPVKDLKIEIDKSETTGYDFTVEDFYTFFTSDGIAAYDCMAVYIPITDQSKKDIEEKLLIHNNLISPANGEIVIMPNQDIVLGIYSLTKDSGEEKKEYKKNIKVTKDNGEIVEMEELAMLTPGQIIFNNILPKNYPIVKTCVEKNLLSYILNRLQETIGSHALMKILDNIKTIGLAKATLKGHTLSISSLYNPDLDVYLDTLTGNYMEDLHNIKNNAELHKKMREMPFSVFIDSGARGSWQQATQLIFCRGYVADHTNKVRPNLIKSSLIKGLTPDDFFNSCWGCRKGLLDTATSTGASGYLTRQLIYSTQFLKLDEIEDCHTTEYLPLELLCYKIDSSGKEIPDIDASKKLLKSIKHRYYLDINTGEEKLIKEISVKKEEEFILNNKILKLRSPIFCKSENICKRCYGDLWKKINSTQIGILASQSISERLTQLVLKTFHLSGASSSTTSKGGNKDIISEMTILNTYFHKPDKICSPYEPEILTKKLFELMVNFGMLYLIHIEVLISCMIWTKDNELWRNNKNRSNKDIERLWNSILKIPSLQSWLIGCAFSNLKGKLLDGVVRKREDISSSISALFKY